MGKEANQSIDLDIDEMKVKRRRPTDTTDTDGPEGKNRRRSFGKSLPRHRSSDFGGAFEIISLGHWASPRFSSRVNKQPHLSRHSILLPRQSPAKSVYVRICTVSYVQVTLKFEFKMSALCFYVGIRPAHLPPNFKKALSFWREARRCIQKIKNPQ